MNRTMKIWLSIGLTIAVLVCASPVLYNYNLFGNRKYESSHFGIATYTSEQDQDQDGVDDQTDILNNVRDYIATKPIYRSKYYGTGYSVDRCGVCTDVVANGLRYAGYDLMNLVEEDIEKNPADYGEDVGDINIDFRRVRNLKVYFKHTAIELTTDVQDIEEWQGGDIVIFESHIGIVSDKRNADGIPYVIHNGSQWQTSYEQDILENREDIVGHYRIS